MGKAFFWCKDHFLECSYLRMSTRLAMLSQSGIGAGGSDAPTYGWTTGVWKNFGKCLEEWQQMIVRMAANDCKNGSK